MKKTGATANGKLKDTIDWYGQGWLFRYEDGQEPRMLDDMEKYVSLLNWIKTYKGQKINRTNYNYIFHHLGFLIRDGLTMEQIMTVLSAETAI